LAHVLDKLGRREQANQEGHRALEALERLGAAHEALRASVFLKSLSAQPQRAAIGPADALTPRERQLRR
jgi:hypothetical protein